MSSPRVEDLDELCTVFNLIESIVSNTVGKILEDGVQKLGLVESHLLNFQVFFRSLSLDHVSGKGVGASNESQNGGFGANLFAKNLESLSNEGSCSSRINRVHLRRI